jgi:hypothetical protein
VAASSPPRRPLRHCVQSSSDARTEVAELAGVDELLRPGAPTASPVADLLPPAESRRPHRRIEDPRHGSSHRRRIEDLLRNGPYSSSASMLWTSSRASSCSSVSAWGGAAQRWREQGRGGRHRDKGWWGR